MIHVNRGPAPEGFAKDAALWHHSFLEKRKKDAKLTTSTFWSTVRQRSTLKKYAGQLFQACCHKCAFCESKPESSSALQIEHFRPKGNPRFENLMFDWDNWLASCGRCNSNKWKHFPDCGGTPCLIDPALEDPKEHIEFIAADALGKTHRGEKTIRLLDLERSPLKDERAAWLMTINSLLLLCLVPEAYSAARSFLIWAMQPDAPYSAMTFCYLRKLTPQLAHPEKPHPQISFQNPAKEIADLVETYQVDLKTLS